MKVQVVKDYQEMSKVAADIVANVVREKSSPVLGLATGSTPLVLYEILSQFCRQKKLSFQKVKTVNLDEYVGLGKNDEQSYVHFMHSNLFDKVDLPEENTHLPNGLASDLQQECARYHQLLQDYTQDVQILGLGSNGHIGFNEPNTPFDSTTHLVSLADSTIKDNARFFKDISQVPTRAITMGIAEIMRAKKILVLASGSNKADAVYKMVKGKVTEQCPASILQLHPDCTVLVDEAAASKL